MPVLRLKLGCMRLLFSSFGLSGFACRLTRIIIVLSYVSIDSLYKTVRLCTELSKCDTSQSGRLDFQRLPIYGTASLNQSFGRSNVVRTIPRAPPRCLATMISESPFSDSLSISTISASCSIAPDSRKSDSRGLRFSFALRRFN